ncbi:MAG: 30S ribosomal protein S1 [Rhodospirillales bacterium]|nr:30S ribosomal protein S1 [Alphaproteobacteria bacterium]USO04166.1 MAG: 30S ribosomal protein S1 [Rhodospirillales bacterium]
MAHIAANLKDNEDSTEFAALLASSMTQAGSFEGSVIKGKIIDIDDDAVLVDVGLKSEGRISLREFSTPGSDPEVRIGDEVEVYVDRMEGRNGETVLSREKARREEVWIELEKQSEAKERVTGLIFGRVKGGFTVDLGGAVAFLPGSQVDIRPVRDVSPLMGTPQPFLILKMDRSRGNIVVSRRAVLEESRDEARSDLMDTLQEGSVVQGVVKNITDYGAFVDLGGIDGLLHVTDISWKRVNHPSDVLQVGQNIDVQIIRYNKENGRISLGMKQLENDPWEGVEAKYPVKAKYKGRVTNITDYGAFVELEDGIEGLVHVSEMSWTKKNVHPGKIVSTSEEVEVMVLEVDNSKRRISLGLKQCQDNPWADFADKHKVGEILEGEIRNITEFGLFVGVDDDIDGMVHISDISWEDQTEDVLKAFEKDQKIKVKILDIDPEKERVALGIKQLSADPYEGIAEGLAKGAIVTCTVSEIGDRGIEVTVNDGITGTIKKADLSRERSEQRPDRFAIGEKVDAKIMSFDKKKKHLTLSIKAHEIAEDKAALEAFGSTESGASLGDILGAALSKGGAEAAAAKEQPKKAPAKKAAKKADKGDAETAEDVKEEKPKAKSKTKAKEKAEKADK